MSDDEHQRRDLPANDTGRATSSPQGRGAVNLRGAGRRDYRQHEDVLEYCGRHNIAFISWFPVAAGKLARPGGKLDKIAKRHGATVAQLSIAWLLHHSAVILPIPGTSSVAHLEENIKGAHVALSEAEMAEIEKAAQA